MAEFKLETLVSFLGKIDPSECGDEEQKSLLSKLNDFNKVKEDLFLHLINYEKHKDELARLPHRDFLDLSVIIVLKIKTGKDYLFTVKVNDQLLEVWNKTFDEVYQVAFDNFKKEKTVIYSVNDVLKKNGYDIEDLEADKFPLYGISNEDNCQGAIHMLDEESLSKLSHVLQSDLAILPSSIHEVLVVPFCDNASDLNEMVRNVNQTLVVEPSEYLSDHIYVYCRDKGWAESLFL